MKNCQHLYFLSAIACQLAECLDENELSVLSADLQVLGDMLDSLLTRSACVEAKSSASVSEQSEDRSLLL